MSPADGGAPDQSAGAGCPLAVAGVCSQGECLVMGMSYPATLAGWCESPAGELAGLTSSQPAAPACRGWTVVSAPSGDQAIDFYYDASGEIVAILRTASSPPCEGACRYECVAGPSDLDPSQLSACASDGAHALSCGADGGAD